MLYFANQVLGRYFLLSISFFLYFFSGETPGSAVLISNGGIIFVQNDLWPFGAMINSGLLYFLYDRHCWTLMKTDSFC